MFAGETSDSLALANTVVLTRLIEELIRRDIIAKNDANTILRDAESSLRNCPERSSRVEDAIRIIRKELMPSFAATPAE